LLSQYPVTPYQEKKDESYIYEKLPRIYRVGLYWSIRSAIFITSIFTDIKYGVRKKNLAWFL
jgi:hypothetical protein